MLYERLPEIHIHKQVPHKQLNFTKLMLKVVKMLFEFLKYFIFSISVMYFFMLEVINHNDYRLPRNCKREHEYYTFFFLYSFTTLTPPLYFISNSECNKRDFPNFRTHTDIKNFILTASSHLKQNISVIV